MTITQDDGTKTKYFVLLKIHFAAAAKLQLELSHDVITTPVLHRLSLAYDFTVIASAGDGGSISPSGAVIVPFGGSQTFQIAPSTGCCIAGVTADAVSQGTTGSYPFIKVRLTIPSLPPSLPTRILFITSASASVTGTVDTSISVSSATTNQEGAAAGSFKVGLYLIRNGIDYYLVDWIIALLSAVATDLATTTVTIPTIPNGDYTINACA